jgi:hypothetical protein
MKAITKNQLKRINDKVLKKYNHVNVTFTFYNVFQAKFTDIVQNDTDMYYYQLWNSIIANEVSFDEVYYSI